MTVILNAAALEALLETQEGPVGRFVERIADAVIVNAEVQFDEYFHGVLPPKQNILSRMDGSTATIGYSRTAGSKAERLAQAEAAGKLTNPPLQQALEAVRNGG